MEVSDWLREKKVFTLSEYFIALLEYILLFKFIGEKKSEKDNQNKLADDSYLSIEEAASYLKIAKQTLYSFTSKRTLPFLKKGKKIYFEKTQLDTWLKQGLKKSVSELNLEFENGKR